MYVDQAFHCKNTAVIDQASKPTSWKSSMDGCGKIINNSSNFFPCFLLTKHFRSILVNYPNMTSSHMLILFDIIVDQIEEIVILIGSVIVAGFIVMIMWRRSSLSRLLWRSNGCLAFSLFGCCLARGDQSQSDDEEECESIPDHSDCLKFLLIYLNQIQNQIVNCRVLISAYIYSAWQLIKID